MEALKKRIEESSENLGSGILKVDTFVNHQLDALLMLQCASVIAARFPNPNSGITKVLTAETSGIGPGLLTGLLLGVPTLFARKVRPITMPDPVYKAKAPSHTKEEGGLLIVSGELLSPKDKVLIVDDFLATGKTISALVRICEQAGPLIVGIAALIEKRFEGGRNLLRNKIGTEVPIISLVNIEHMEPEPGGKIVIAN